MNKSKFVLELEAQNNWEHPLSLQGFNEVSDEVLSDLIVYGYSQGMLPIILSNLEILSSISIDGKIWIKSIKKAITKDDKYMMGLINLVDVFFKYLKIDIRPILIELKEIANKKINQVLDYYIDCPFCLIIRDEDRNIQLKKYRVSSKDVKQLRLVFLEIGASLI